MLACWWAGSGLLWNCGLLGSVVCPRVGGAGSWASGEVGRAVHSGSSSGNPGVWRLRAQEVLGLLSGPESSRKTSTSVVLTMSKALTVWLTTNCGKFLK